MHSRSKNQGNITVHFYSSVHEILARLCYFQIHNKIKSIFIKLCIYEQCQQPKNKEINMIVLNDHSPNGLFRDNEKKPAKTRACKLIT